MASLNLDLEYFDNVKVIRLVARLGPGSDVLPIRLWCYQGRHSPESAQVALLEAELEHVCGWWGQKGAMVAAMVAVNLLIRRKNVFLINDWLTHSGHLKAFKLKAQNAAKIRWKKHYAPSIAKESPKQSVEQCPSSAVPAVLAKQDVVVTARPLSAGTTKPKPKAKIHPKRLAGTDEIDLYDLARKQGRIKPIGNLKFSEGD